MPGVVSVFPNLKRRLHTTHSAVAQNIYTSFDGGGSKIFGKKYSIYIYI